MPPTEEEIRQADFNPEPLEVPEERRRDEFGQYAAEDKPAPVVPTHSPRMVRMARDFGMTEHDLANYTPDELEDFVHASQRQLLNAARTPRQEAHPQAPAPRQAEEPSLLSEAEFEELDPRLHKPLKTLFERDKAREKKLANLEALEGRRQAEAVNSRWDRAFAKHAAILGDDTWHEIDPESEHSLLRSMVSAAVLADRSTRTFQAKVDRAVAVLSKGRAPAQEQVEEEDPRLTQRKQDFAEGGLAVPSQRTPAKEQPGLELAKKTFINGMRKLGQPVTGQTGGANEF